MRLIMRRQPVLPTSIPELNIAMAEEDSRRRSLNPDQRERDNIATSALQARRPWLFAQNSFTDLSGGGTARSKRWTLPGPLDDEEMKEWEAGLRDGVAEADREVPTFSNSFGGGSVAGPSRLAGKKRFSDDIDHLDSRTETPDMGPSHSLLPSTDTRTSTPNVYPYPPTPRVSGYYTPRGTMSLELARPPVSGKELADEADMYALSRGARRPDYGRMRGDSRAALLGRPEVDWERDSDKDSESGSTRFRGALGKKREVSGGSERRMSFESGIGKGLGVNKDKEREYGRARGDSGAALMGRPDGSVSGRI
jgi:hypothetical protein